MISRCSRLAFELAAIVLLLGLVGGLVAASGIVPVKASSGHWAITEWLLQFGKRRSLATHTMGLDLPSLADRALVLKGAGHYEGGCRPCHGSPGFWRPRVAAAMLPRAPELLPIIAEREPEELFYIVKHGIKFTGMPAWPALERDDEVQAVVAFLLELPKLDAHAYRRLIDGNAPSSGTVQPLAGLTEPRRAPGAVLSSCARCHGADGAGRGLGAFPKLAGQGRDYVLSALDAYAEGRRHSGIMEPIAAALDPAERRELADYYANLAPSLTAATSVASVPAADERIRRGAEIAHEGAPTEGVPSCVDCHGPGTRPRKSAYPNLAGQYASYLVLQLELLQKGNRGGSPYVHIMRHVATRLTREQMRDVAAYYASLPAGGEETAR